MKRLIAALALALFCTGAEAQPSQLPVPGGGATIVGSFTAGNLLVGNSSGQVVDSSSRTASPGYVLLPAGLHINSNGSNLISGGTMTGLFTVFEGVNTGSVTSGTAYFNSLTISADQVDAFSSSSGATIGFEIGHQFGGSSVTGGRVAQSVSLVQTATTGNVAASHLGQYYTASLTQITLQANDGGTGGSPASNGYAFNAIAQLNSGATFYRNLAAAEFDVSVAETTSPPLYRDGIEIVQLTTDAAQGTTSDAGIVFSAQVGTTFKGWKRGISFGKATGYWPIDSAGTIIGTQTGSASGTPPAYAAAWGMDFSAVTFSSGFLKSTGFQVDGTGITTISPAGSATAPSIVLANCGTGCGFYAPAAAQWALTTGGAIKFDYNIAAANRFSFYQGVNFGGVLQANSAIIAAGSAPTATGTCPINTQVGGNIAGKFSMNGACAAGTVILTFSITAPNGWACDTTDQTTAADNLNQTASSTTTATFTGTTANADVISFKCVAF